MICTITTQTGNSAYAKAAQEYALSLSNSLNARLRVVTKWDDEDVPSVVNALSIAKQGAHNVAELAGQLDIPVVESDCVDQESVLGEAQMSDLFVVGMPTDADVAHDDNQTAALQDHERPLLHDAECSILVVNKPPKRSIQNILVNYQGGIEGKAALRVAGELASGSGAKVTVLSLHGDISQASKMANTAKDYLAGYDLKEIEILDETGVPESWVDIHNIAQSCDADMVVLGEDPYGVLDRLLSKNIGERMADATDTPVLLAR